jgi:hypothetical protein
LQNVACLIGIARNQRPEAGVIGVPFPDGTSTSASQIYYAMANQSNGGGVWPKPLEEYWPSFDINDDNAAVVTIFTPKIQYSSMPPISPRKLLHITNMSLLVELLPNYDW